MLKVSSYRIVIAIALLLLLVLPVTAQDLGTADNPIVWAFVPSSDSETVLAGATQIGDLIEEQTGLVVEIVVATDYSSVIEAMCNGEAQMGALNTFGYVLASGRGCAEVAMVSERFGSTFYSGQIITLNGSGIESIADLAGTTFCRPDPLSTSGWIIPSITMQANGINPETDLAEIVDANGHDGVVNAVINGDCDAGATFVDARSSVEGSVDLTTVIAESVPIPNDTISFATDFPADMQAAIVEALLAISADEDSAAVLSDTYNWDALVESTDAFFDDFRQQLDAAGISVEELN